MSQPLEIPLDLHEDENGNLTYVGHDRRGTFTVYIDGQKPRLVVRPRGHRPQVEIIRRPESMRSMKSLFLDEIRRADESLPYVGYGFFLTHWKSPKLPFGVDNRKPVVEALIATGEVEVYKAHDGKDAIRAK